jgi:hypothetical protein
VNGKIGENRRLAMSELSTHFPHFFLATDRFSSDNEVKTAVQHWVKTLAVNFAEGTQKLVLGCDKCLNLGGILCQKVAKTSKLVKTKKYL